MKSRLLGAVCACLITLPFNVNAIVVNTLNGIDYEWLELTHTQGLSRAQVEAQIAAANPGDLLYGYEYASRELIKDLLLSYSSWDGLNGLHGDTSVVNGMFAYLSDFGGPFSTAYLSGGMYNTVDGYTVPIFKSTDALGIYGSTGECGSGSCYVWSQIYFDVGDNPTVARQQDRGGYDNEVLYPYVVSNTFTQNNAGSHLVRVSAVPVPAAAWLFGSGLLGLIAMARRKNNQ